MPRSGQAGLTLVELIVAFSLMLILSLMALPVARVKVQREKERRLREGLHEIRQAIDRYKDLADEGRLSQVDPDNHGYPESLDALVDGIELGEQSQLPTGGPGALSNQARAMGGIGETRRFGSGTGANTPFGSRLQPGSREGSYADDPLRRGDPLARDSESAKTIRFLRSIPLDPMTGRREWGLLSVSDDPESRSWSGRNVFDVYSLSNGIALDGTRYSEW